MCLAVAMLRNVVMLEIPLEIRSGENVRIAFMHPPNFASFPVLTQRPTRM